MNRRIRIVIVWCLALVWMAGIFYLSHQSSQSSGKISEAVAQKVYENIDLTPERFEYKNDTWLLAHYEHFVRKFAHLLLFIVLGILLSTAFAQHYRKKRKIFVISTVLGVIYAISDELHQFFIPGRSFLWEDILIDSAGVVIGTGTVVLVILSASKLRKRLRHTK